MVSEDPEQTFEGHREVSWIWMLGDINEVAGMQGIEDGEQRYSWEVGKLFIFIYDNLQHCAVSGSNMGMGTVVQ